MACSGRSARSRLSYFQSPTAPNSTASAAFARLSVASGSGWPWRSYAAPPTSRVLHLEAQVERLQDSHGLGHDLGADAVAGKDCDLHGSLSVFLGSCRVRIEFALSGRAGCRATASSRALGLELADLVGVAQREADVVEAVDEAVLAERLHVERELVPSGLTTTWRGRSMESGSRRTPRPRRTTGPLRLRQHDRQQAALEAVGEEDVREARRDDGAEAVLVERPRGVLAAGAAAEVASRDQHGRAGVARLVEHEVGFGLRVAGSWPGSPGSR
jgi:hypothetical protein